MAQTLTVYAVAALLLVAGSGPTLQMVRDGSLAEFEELGEWRTLDEFPFLEEVRPYLPPLVVDWIIVQRDRPLDLPPGVDYRFDEKGRVVLVWPDGCEESEERWREDSTCDPDNPTDCSEDPTAPECDPCADPSSEHPACVPPECPAGENVHPDWPHGETDCVPDPACAEPSDNSTRPAQCPAGPPPPEACGNGTVAAYDGTCVSLAPEKLRHVVFRSDSETRTFAVELKVPYENLSLALDHTGFPSPGWHIKLFDSVTGEGICFQNDDSPRASDCEPQRDAGSAITEGTVRYSDRVEGTIQSANLTLFVQFERHQAGPGALEVRLYGKASEVPDATTDE